MSAFSFSKIIAFSLSACKDTKKIPNSQMFGIFFTFYSIFSDFPPRADLLLSPVKGRLGKVPH